MTHSRPPHGSAIKEPATKPDDLSQPWNPQWKDGTESHRLPTDLHMYMVTHTSLHTCAYTSAYTHKT